MEKLGKLRDDRDEASKRYDAAVLADEIPSKAAQAEAQRILDRTAERVLANGEDGECSLRAGPGGG